MKTFVITLALVVTSFAGMSFMFHTITPEEMVGTKWIAPINDNCFESLCFTSTTTVMYYRCDKNIYTELGYQINGNSIKIEAFSNGSMDSANQLILTFEMKILKQPSTQNNSFPDNFIIVPNGVCN